MVAPPVRIQTSATTIRYISEGFRELSSRWFQCREQACGAAVHRLPPCSGTSPGPDGRSCPCAGGFLESLQRRVSAFMIRSHLAVVGSLCFQKFPPSDPHFPFVIGHKHARTQRHTHTRMYTHAHMHPSLAAERLAAS